MCLHKRLLGTFRRYLHLFFPTFVCAAENSCYFGPAPRVAFLLPTRCLEEILSSSQPPGLPWSCCPTRSISCGPHERPGAWSKLKHPGRSPSPPFILGLRFCTNPPNPWSSRDFQGSAAKTSGCRAVAVVPAGAPGRTKWFLPTCSREGIKCVCAC